MLRFSHGGLIVYIHTRELRRHCPLARISCCAKISCRAWSRRWLNARFPRAATFGGLAAYLHTGVRSRCYQAPSNLLIWIQRQLNVISSFGCNFRCTFLFFLDAAPIRCLSKQQVSWHFLRFVAHISDTGLPGVSLIRNTSGYMQGNMVGSTI